MIVFRLGATPRLCFEKYVDVSIGEASTMYALYMLI